MFMGVQEAMCTGSRGHRGRGPVCTGLAEQLTRVLKLALHGHVDVDACVYLPEMLAQESLHLSVFSKMRKTVTVLDEGLELLHALVHLGVDEVLHSIELVVVVVDRR